MSHYFSDTEVFETCFLFLHVMMMMMMMIVRTLTKTPRCDNQK